MPDEIKLWQWIYTIKSGRDFELSHCKYATKKEAAAGIGVPIESIIEHYCPRSQDVRIIGNFSELIENRRALNWLEFQMCNAEFWHLGNKSSKIYIELGKGKSLTEIVKEFTGGKL